jgi:ribosomal protein L32
MAKHPVPKYKTTKSKTRTRHSAFMSRTRIKLFQVVDKMKNLELKGNLKLREKKKKVEVKKIKA